MVDYLKIMEDMNIKANWGTIYLGWIGPGRFTRLLSFEDIFNYGSGKLESNFNKEVQIVTELLSLYGDARENDTELIKDYLLQLSNMADYDEMIETKKWAVVLLNQLVITFSHSSDVEILTELTDFWANFDYPEYSPHVIQGRQNRINPQEYYSKEFANKMILRHEEWIANQRVVFKNI